MSSIIITICVFLFLNIPVAIIFHKAGVRSINAFIPFKNVISYLWIVDFKVKYIVALLMILASFFLCWDMNKGYGLYASGFFQGLRVRCLLLLSIPTCMVFWCFFGTSSLLTTFMCLIRAGKHCSLYHGATPLVFFGSIFMFIFLIMFYGKLAYKLALKFGWSRWWALIYMFFQPIAVWVLAFGGWKYNGSCSKSELNKNRNVSQSVSGAQSDVGIVSNQINTVSENEGGQGNTLSSEIVSQNNQVMQEKKNDRFFRNAMLIIIIVLIGSFLLVYVPKYRHANVILKERQEERKQKTEKIVGELEKGDLDCGEQYDELYSYFASKLPKDIQKNGYGVNGALIKRETDGACFEAYNFNYRDNIDGKDVSVFDYVIADYRTKEVLFRCIDHDFKLFSLEDNGKGLDTSKGCSSLYDRMYKEYKHGFVAYDEEGKLKDYDDFEDPLLSKKLKKFNLVITTSCENIFRTRGNTNDDRYYYLTGKNELILLGQLGYQRDNCEKYEDAIKNALNGIVVVKDGYKLNDKGEIEYVGGRY